MSTDRRNILIVDDIELNREILYELFHDQYNVLEAENGQVALDLITEYGQTIAIVLLDIVMPVMDGFGVLKNMILDKSIETIPVIMITAESDEEKALMGYSMGVVDIINKPFNPDIVRRRVQNTVDLYLHKFYLEDMVEKQTKALELQNEQLKMSNTFVIDALSTAVEFRDHESGQHIIRIRALTKILLETLSELNEKYRLSPEEINDIASASAMHDIGKIAISDLVLLKPGRLTAEEFTIMKTHTTEGCAILESINFTGNLAYYKYCYDICRHHHERWDGRGYPDGLKGDEIPLWAQVVSLADVYDALTSDRVYKPALSHDVAVKMIMDGECGVFNPEMLASFEKIAVQFLDPEKIKEKSVLTASAPSVRTSDADILLLSDAGNPAELERTKLRIITKLADDAIVDYDIKTDTARLSKGFMDMMGLNDETISGFRHFLLSNENIDEKRRGHLLNEVLKLNRRNPDMETEMNVKIASGDAALRVHVAAVFESEDENASKAGYVAKIVKI
ncbi:MAG: response regulator [Clostridiales Family XIII bacterium]|jgi:putative two-component system response regulator|nr:response regulator [Clostridiales Family XIII bacterium]